jgi:hypothetical protein
VLSRWRVHSFCADRPHAKWLSLNNVLNFVRGTMRSIATQSPPSSRQKIQAGTRALKTQPRWRHKDLLPVCCYSSYTKPLYDRPYLID